MSITKTGATYIVDSAKRSTGTAENFSYTIQIPQDHAFDRVAVLGVTVPKSYYMIDAPYNTFVLTEGVTSVTITVPPGNTNVIAWLPIMSTLLTTNSPNHWVYTVTYPDDTKEMDDGKFTYSVIGATSQPIISFPSTSKLYEQFGFVKESVNTFSSGSVKSTCILKFQQENILHLHSSCCHSASGDLAGNLLIEIYSSTIPPFSDITYQCTILEAYSKKLVSPDSNTFTFYLSDKHCQPILLNGLDWSMTLYMYKKDDINEILASNILINK